MKSDFLIIVSVVTLSSLVLSSCDTPAGQGAGAGAAAGAIIGGAATGHVRGAAIGAAAGAAAGALIGAASRRIKPHATVRPRRAAFRSPDSAAGRDCSIARTPIVSTISAAFHAADSLATSTLASSSESRDRAPVCLMKARCGWNNQRVCACSESTSACASSVIFSNSGQGR
jgi:predicted small secreted protein